MKVFVDTTGGWTLVGMADLPADHDEEFVVHLFRDSDILEERFVIRTAPPGLKHVSEGDCVVVARPDQIVELLPNWQPMAS